MIAHAHKSEVLTKSLRVPVGTADVIPVEKVKWERIKRRVRHLGKRKSIYWLSSGASAFGSLTAGVILAAIAIPNGKHSEMEPWIQPALFAGAAICALLATVLFCFFLIESRGREQERADILDEMETEEDAWRG